MSQAVECSNAEPVAATLASPPQPPLSAAEQADERVREAVAALRMAHPQPQACPPVRTAAAAPAELGPPASLAPADALPRADALPPLLVAAGAAQVDDAPHTPERPPPTPPQAAPQQMTPPSCGAAAAGAQGLSSGQVGSSQVPEGAYALTPAGSGLEAPAGSTEALTPGRRRAEYDMLQQELNKVLSRRHSEAALSELEAQLSRCRSLTRSASEALRFDEHSPARPDPLRSTRAGKLAAAAALERSSGGSSSPDGSPLGGSASPGSGDGARSAPRRGYQQALDTHAEDWGSALQRPQSAPPGAPIKAHLSVWTGLRAHAYTGMRVCVPGMHVYSSAYTSAHGSPLQRAQLIFAAGAAAGSAQQLCCMCILHTCIYASILPCPVPAASACLSASAC